MVSPTATLARSVVKVAVFLAPPTLTWMSACLSSAAAECVRPRPGLVCRDRARLGFPPPVEHPRVGSARAGPVALGLERLTEVERRARVRADVGQSEAVRGPPLQEGQGVVDAVGEEIRGSRVSIGERVRARMPEIDV